MHADHIIIALLYLPLCIKDHNIGFHFCLQLAACVASVEGGATPVKKKSAKKSPPSKKKTTARKPPPVMVRGRPTQIVKISMVVSPTLSMPIYDTYNGYTLPKRGP